MRFLLLMSLLAVAACTGSANVRDLQMSPAAFGSQQTFAVRAIPPAAVVVRLAPGSEEARLDVAIADILTAKGYVPASADPDLLVEYTAYLREPYVYAWPEDFSDHIWFRIDPAQVAATRGSGLSGYLHVRVIDARSGEIVWSGLATRVASLHDRDGRLLDGVNRLLAGLPLRR